MSDWRDGYDAWKLATPPQYEMTDEEEERHERDQAEGRIDALMQEEQTDETTAEVARLQARLDSKPCPNCSVEWADQYLGDCDVCHGTRRVQRKIEIYDGEAIDIYDETAADDDNDWCPF